MKPTWESDCGDVKLWQGDCLEVMATWPDGAVDAVVTDPPYGINANNQTLGRGRKRFYRGGDWDSKAPSVEWLLKFGTEHVFWGGNYLSDLPVSADWLVWHKLNDGRSFSEVELAWTNVGCRGRHFSHHWSGETKRHPTQKPLRVMQWCIGFTSGATIADPFMGSGTTGVAAVRAVRKFWGVELEPQYFEIAKRRIQDELHKVAFLEGNLSRRKEHQQTLFTK